VAITGSDVGLDLLRCIVSGAAWPKAETRLRELGIEDRREDLQDGLLDQAIDHACSTGKSGTTRMFRDLSFASPPVAARLPERVNWTLGGLASN
jgi:hypothetical protein